MLEERGVAAILHDVHHGYAAEAVDVVVVVEDGVGVDVDKYVAIAERLGGCP